ncbi:hypothetical protein FKM82_016000 [Ascaphus truei]
MLGVVVLLQNFCPELGTKSCSPGLGVMAEAPLRRGRPPLSPDTRAKRRRESRLKIHDTRITIGNTFDDWMSIKDEKGFTKHEEVARCLINTYRKYNRMFKEQSLQSSQESSSDAHTKAGEGIGSETFLPLETGHPVEDYLCGPGGMSSPTNPLLLAKHYNDILSTSIASHHVIPTFESTSARSDLPPKEFKSEKDSSEDDEEEDSFDDSYHLSQEEFEKTNPADNTIKEEIFEVIISNEESDVDDGSAIGHETEDLREAHLQNGRLNLQLPIWPHSIRCHPLYCGPKSEQMQRVAGQTDPCPKSAILIQTDLPR